MIKKMSAKSAVEMEDVAKFALHEMRTKNKLEKNEGSASVFLLSGELGAGKTTFSQAVGMLLGVTERITSPTFVIQKEYETKDAEFKRLVHIDAYRLESFADLKLLGWDEFAKDPHTLILLEWPEQVRDAKFTKGFLLKFSHLESGGREVAFYDL